MSKIISITKAKYIDGYKISLIFNDGKRKILDFRDFILSSTHPEIQKYRDIKLFKNFSLSYGDLEWNDYDLAFPVYDLYRGEI